MKYCKLAILIILLNLASVAYAGTTTISDTDNSITINTIVSQHTQENGPVGDSDKGITIAAYIYQVVEQEVEITRPASYDLEASVNDSTLTTGQQANFSVVFTETPELTNTKTTSIAGDVDNGISIQCSIFQGRGVVGDTDNEINISGEIGGGAGATVDEVTIVAMISQNKNGSGPVGDSHEGITITGVIILGSSGAGATLDDITINSYITQGNLSGNPYVGTSTNDIAISAKIGKEAGSTDGGITITGQIYQSVSGGAEEEPLPSDNWLKYSWDFDGDGIYDFESAATGSAVKSYSGAGTYVATARVIASDGVPNYATVVITVSGTTIVKDCAITPGQTFNISLGANAGPVNATYNNFASTPTIDSVVCASAPSSAVLIGGGNCATGNCSFTCGPYDIETTEFVTVLILSDGGELVKCTDFATVSFGAACTDSLTIKYNSSEGEQVLNITGFATGWQYIAATFHGGNNIPAENRETKAFLGNGIADSASEASATDEYITDNANSLLAGDILSAFSGIIDELRISNTARSDAWIKTGYNNQNNPAGFYTVGTEETP